MIREVCSCGAEFETDDREAIQLIKSWRRTHKHSNKALDGSRDGATVLSDSQVALGFQSIYDPLQCDSDDSNN
jgi:hypothetical protein